MLKDGDDKESFTSMDMYVRGTGEIIQLVEIIKN